QAQADALRRPGRLPGLTGGRSGGAALVACGSGQLSQYPQRVLQRDRVIVLDSGEHLLDPLAHQRGGLDSVGLGVRLDPALGTKRDARNEVVTSIASTDSAVTGSGVVCRRAAS